MTFLLEEGNGRRICTKRNANLVCNTITLSDIVNIVHLVKGFTHFRGSYSLKGFLVLCWSLKTNVISCNVMSGFMYVCVTQYMPKKCFQDLMVMLPQIEKVCRNNKTFEWFLHFMVDKPSIQSF